MKLKLGNTTLNQKALANLLLICLLTGLFIGFKVWFRAEGKNGSFFPLLIILTLIIPRLVRGIKQEIENEREIENDEKR